MNSRWRLPFLLLLHCSLFYVYARCLLLCPPSTPYIYSYLTVYVWPLTKEPLSEPLPGPPFSAKIGQVAVPY